MTEEELKTDYTTVYLMILRERRKREAVLSHSPLLQKKLQECDAALNALERIKDFAKPHVVASEPPLTQAPLLDTLPTRKGIYP